MPEDEQQDQEQEIETHDIPDFADGDEPVVEDELQSARNALEEVEQKLLRVSADYQNYVKRNQQSQQLMLDEQLMRVARDLVVVMDHFDRAVQVEPEQVTSKAVLDGVNIVRDELLRTLGKYGVERVDAQIGEPFDPNRHEAMMRSPVEDMESNHVAMQLQPGYLLREKTIRPAGVSVSE